MDNNVWAPWEPKKLKGVPLCMALDATKEYKAITAFCNYLKHFVCVI